MTDIGVLQKERDRQKAWVDLGLPDPVQVLSEERMTRLKTGRPFVSPKRALLNSYLAENPDKAPNSW